MNRHPIATDNSPPSLHAALPRSGAVSSTSVRRQLRSPPSKRISPLDAGAATIPVPSGSESRIVAAPASNGDIRLDRKSTRLNSSHVAISYAVFCLIKKKQLHHQP